ncbi:unnamed protein product [Nippostrongylus brasiliensis]|uniref:SCP domain-containing protein n=1 Tax=Nippostrongylus brasiliensis TaxID=27835 RepID=A0A0N4Y162_NIPBR|nr:unnamed protein product [Nippostrongylus brasiliensis]
MARPAHLGNAKAPVKITEKVLHENELQDEESNSEIRRVRRADGRPPWKIAREKRLQRAQKYAEEYRNICKTNTTECLTFTKWYTGYLLWLEKHEMRDKRREQAEGRKEDGGNLTEATTTAPEACESSGELTFRNFCQPRLLENFGFPRNGHRLQIYDCDIENVAMKYSLKCEFKHSTEWKNLGENMAAIREKQDLKKAAESGVTSWFTELKTAGMGDANVLTWPIFSRPKVIGHYTQVVWQDSYRVGCAAVFCEQSNMTLVTCNYGPAGNVIGGKVYDLGDPCKTDVDCQCNDCKCSQAEALCVKSV